MNFFKKYLFGSAALVFATALLVTSCKKSNYLEGGSLHSAKVNMTTYDYLQSNSAGLFDTLLLLVDRAGLKDKINQQGVTFFAPTDYSINAYLSARAKEEQNIDPFRQWTIDSMIKYEMPKFVDSINIYFVNGALTYDKLTQNGTLYPTLKQGNECVVSYEETRDPALGYNPNVSTIPRIVYFTFLLKQLSPPIVAGDIQSDEGVHTRVQTSGIETTTGMLHVLNNQHKLFFRK
ncbi:MAG: fasciclin domain-containing protein [Ginsengibacter sp.]